MSKACNTSHQHWGMRTDRRLCISQMTHILTFRAAEDGSVLVLKREGRQAQAQSLRELKRAGLCRLPVSSELLGMVFGGAKDLNVAQTSEED